jgi:hypothetical protein
LSGTKLARQNLRALTDAELKEVFASFGRRYWRRTILAIAVGLALFGISFGVPSLVPALCVLALGGLIGVCGVGYALVLAGSQLPVRLEMVRRAKLYKG